MLFATVCLFVLAQIKEIGDAAQRQLDNAATMGSSTYILVLLIVIYSLCQAANWYYVVRPDVEARRKSRQNQDECLHTFSVNYALQSQLLKDMDSHLSQISHHVGIDKPKRESASEIRRRSESIHE